MVEMTKKIVIPVNNMVHKRFSLNDQTMADKS